MICDKILFEICFYFPSTAPGLQVDHVVRVVRVHVVAGVGRGRGVRRGRGGAA